MSQWVNGVHRNFILYETKCLICLYISFHEDLFHDTLSLVFFIFHKLLHYYHKTKTCLGIQKWTLKWLAVMLRIYYIFFFNINFNFIESISKYLIFKIKLNNLILTSTIQVNMKVETIIFNMLILYTCITHL